MEPRSVASGPPAPHARRGSRSLVALLALASALGGCASLPPDAAKPAAGAGATRQAAAEVPRAAPAAPAAAARPAERITLGAAGKTLDLLPIYFAQAQGLFAEEGLDPDLTIARSDVAVAAAVARELDYTTNVQAALSAAVGGAPLVAVYSLKENLLISLVAQPTVVDAQGLRGGTIGHG